jgi:ribulose-bisphosphate carboxylase large chain
MIEPSALVVSGDRFEATYRLDAAGDGASQLAEYITTEQTIEFPPELVPDDDIRSHVFGRVESIHTVGNSSLVRISYAAEVAGGTLPQLLTVLFGNISMTPGVRLESVELSPGVSDQFEGPRYGSTGIRELAGGRPGPLLCAALKPMGLSSSRLASMAYEYAAGGADLIKDDHGISTQPFAPFEDRVKACADAVSAANDSTGGSTLYFPTLTVPFGEVLDAAHYAKQQGAAGLLVLPGIVGFETMRTLAAATDLGLAIMAHPAFLGTYSMSPRHGLSHGFLYGQLARIAGADISIFPTYGGRFAFTQEDCREIVDAATGPLGGYAAALPAPGGGVSLDGLPQLIRFYGNDVVFLIGGGLHRSADVRGEVARFRRSAREHGGDRQGTRDMEHSMEERLGGES